AKDGRGMLNVLAADKLMLAPKLYATFLLWLLSELFEELPEIGDPEKPVFVFFFDEAHLLFDDAPDALMDKIEQVVRLIRSKGVGVYFVTQNPQDVPDEISSQLGNRIQHALRAFTPKEQRVIKAAAETFRANPKFKSIDVITELGIGEALVSTLLKKGVPSMVERTLIRPPSSRLGPISEKERQAIRAASDLGDKYDEMIDRFSAEESLKQRQENIAKRQQKEKDRITKEEERDKRDLAKARKKRKGRSTGRRRSRRMSTTEKMAGQATRTATRTLVNALVRGILGSFRR
ncbi:MAG: helicase HerA-like domain-containing protein, partial [Parvularculaceae bacterium]